jgi:hypothetical protein
MVQDKDAKIPSTRKGVRGEIFLHWGLIFFGVLSVELFHINYWRPYFFGFVYSCCIIKFVTNILDTIHRTSLFITTVIFSNIIWFNSGSHVNNYLYTTEGTLTSSPP